MEQLYFRYEDSEECYQLKFHLAEAKEEGLTEVELIEAIPDKDNKEYCWCNYDGSATEKRDCNSKNCDCYTKTSGRFCDYRGRLFTHGESKKFKVE